MKIKLFGRELFEIGAKRGDLLFAQSSNEVRESKYLPDFRKAQGDMNQGVFSEYVITNVGSGAVAVPVSDKKPKEAAAGKVEITVTPKGIFELKALHDDSFRINTDAAYVDGQIADFKDKLSLIQREEYDMSNGVQEISSVIVRLENRKKYAEAGGVFDEFPYTTNAKINGVLKAHTNLRIGKIAQFLADMPKEAVEAMKRYNAGTQKLCSKDAIFYIIAEKKDFEKTEKRRDPILLAQSPFGHFWQILGAWDKEMMLLEDL